MKYSQSLSIYYLKFMFVYIYECVRVHVTVKIEYHIEIFIKIIQYNNIFIKIFQAISSSLHLHSISFFNHSKKLT